VLFRSLEPDVSPLIASARTRPIWVAAEKPASAAVPETLIELLGAIIDSPIGTWCLSVNIIAVRLIPPRARYQMRPIAWPVRATFLDRPIPEPPPGAIKLSQRSAP
jgi:hypothetical protein